MSEREEAMTVKVLIAPSGFKESLSPEEVADCIEKGILRALPEANVLKAPLVDGGEGFTRTLVHVTGGTLHAVKVTGPVGQEVEAHYGFLGGKSPRTAVLEIASAAGLRLVPRDARDPLKTTTRAASFAARRWPNPHRQHRAPDGVRGRRSGSKLLLVTRVEIGHGGGELLRKRGLIRGFDPNLQSSKRCHCNFNHILSGLRGPPSLRTTKRGFSRNRRAACCGA
jgi:glycerate kinase